MRPKFSDGCKTLRVKLDLQDFSRFENYCDRYGFSMSGIVRRLVLDYLDRHDVDGVDSVASAGKVATDVINAKCDRRVLKGARSALSQALTTNDLKYFWDTALRLAVSAGATLPPVIFDRGEQGQQARYTFVSLLGVANG